MELGGVLTDRVALVTGASSGLGRAIAHELATKGCRLVLTGRDPRRLDALDRELRSLGVAAYTHVADLSDESEIEDLVRQATSHVGAIDILINSAGVFPVGLLSEATAVDFDYSFAVNVRGPFLLIQKLAGTMNKNGWGRIVNIGSSSAYVGVANTAIYCATKHALLGLSRSLFQELKGSGVRVYCLSPGSIQTEMGRKVVGQRFETFIQPEEIARYLAFMISFDAEMIPEEVRLNRVTMQ